MRIYAGRSWRAVGQVVTDVCVLGWCVLWYVVGRAVRGVVLTLAEPARETADRAGQLSGQLRSAADQAARLPTVGAGLRQPFDAAAGSLAGIVAAAQAQVAGIERAASLLGWLTFLIPVTVFLALWLPARIRFVLRARAAQRFIDSTADLDLFALRALTSQPMHVLAKISADPVADWRSGNATVIHRLAEAELRRSGPTMPTRVLASEG